VNAIELFVAQVVLSLALSIAALLRLQSIMRRIGNVVCEEGGTATEFWISYTQLMMMIAPLMLVSWVSGPSAYASPVEQVRGALATVLFGQFLGLVLVGRAVWNSFVRKAKPAAPVKPAVVASPAISHPLAAT
jgi:hypothetical protein